jgi:quercetin dioxygenase-like cupin family protein
MVFPPSNSPSHKVTISFLPGSKARAGRHWHDTHDEFLIIRRGIAVVTIGRITSAYSAADGIITVPRDTVHEYRRAEPEIERILKEGKFGEDELNKELVLDEWTEPGDGEKEIFFRNVLGVILDGGEGLWANFLTLWTLFVVFEGNDNFPVLAGDGKVGRLAARFVLGVCSWVGRIFGLRATYDEYSGVKRG